MNVVCPLRMRPDAEDGCCRWDVFVDGFLRAWPRWFDAAPTLKQWQQARRDWRQMNTGFEAVHNALSRVREATIRAAESPLVWLGGRNYAHAGSELAHRFGQPDKPDRAAR